VHVASAADRAARVVRLVDALENKALAAVASEIRIERAQRQHGRKPLRTSEYDVALALVPVATRDVCPSRSDQHVIDPVAVDVANPRNVVARVIGRKVPSVATLEDDASASIAAERRKQARQLECRVEPGRAPEHDVALAGSVARARCADDEIAYTVAVEIPGI